jgi:hypothetical protein
VRDRSFLVLGRSRVVIGLLLLCFALPMSAVARPERPVIRLSCPPAEAALCPALVQALAEAAPGTVIRRVDPGAERPDRPDDLGVALLRDEDGLYLAWRGAEGPLHRAETTVPAAQPNSARSLTQSAAMHLARALLKASPGLHAFLAGRSGHKS